MDYKSYGQSSSFVDYKDYMRSPEWRSKHKEFLRRAGYRCAFSGLSLKKRYNCHHMHYRNLGREAYGRDIVAVHPFIHKWVLHGILSGFKRPSQQVSYPNTAQKIAHGWCLIPGSLKIAIALTPLLLIAASGGYSIGERISRSVHERIKAPKELIQLPAGQNPCLQTKANLPAHKKHKG